MYNTDYVPQHTLIIASVLRYIMTFTEAPILQKYELDAFIITAVAPELSKTENAQELQVSSLYKYYLLNYKEIICLNCGLSHSC